MKYRVVYCAECGMELEVRRKAVPSEQKIYEVIKPHVCMADTVSGTETITVTEAIIEGETGKKKPLPTKLDTLFESFKFVQKLNKLATKPSPVQQETGDKRDRDHLRKELLTSTAPMNLLDNIRNIPPSQAENDVSVEPKGE